MGMSVFSGMLMATLAGVCLVPFLFVVIERLTGGRKNKAQSESPEKPRMEAHG
jgi:HAE1 family hydrophobic/amphiphilic exporter-1